MASPIVAQSIVGLGSWFVFFGIVENLGERQLAITNLVRMVFLFLQIPSWGFASGINTLVSHFIGQQKRQAVVPIIWKTAKFSWLVTMLLANTSCFISYPNIVSFAWFGRYVFDFGGTNLFFMFYWLFLTLNSIGIVYFNGICRSWCYLFWFENTDLVCHRLSRLYFMQWLIFLEGG